MALREKTGYDFGRKGEGGKHEHVDFRVSEDPKEVHPDDGGAAGLGIEEMPSQVPVDDEHELRRGKRAHS